MHQVDGIAYRGPNGAWIWSRDAGVCRVLPGARRAIVYPERGADNRRVGLFLAGIIATFVLYQKGRPALHASAVDTEYGAVAFLGPNGQGKSSMAGSFLRRGSALISDDVLPLEARPDAVCAAPGLPLMKVWPESAKRVLHVTERLPSVVGGHDKQLLLLDARFPVATTRIPLRAFYVLDRCRPVAGGGAEIRVERLTTRPALAVLLAQVARGAYLQPAEAAALLPVYVRLARQAPVRVLHYPDGFEHQDAVYGAIMGDLANGGGL